MGNLKHIIPFFIGLFIFSATAIAQSSDVEHMSWQLIWLDGFMDDKHSEAKNNVLKKTILKTTRADQQINAVYFSAGCNQIVSENLPDHQKTKIPVWKQSTRSCEHGIFVPVHGKSKEYETKLVSWSMDIERKIYESAYNSELVLNPDGTLDWYNQSGKFIARFKQRP